MLYHLSSIVFDILSTDIYIICYFQQVFSKMNMPHYTKSNRIISINSIKIMSTNKCIKKSKYDEALVLRIEDVLQRA